MDDYKIIVEQEHQTVMAHYEVEPKPAEGYQSEAALEKSLIKQLQGQGYEYAHIKDEAGLLKNLRRQQEQQLIVSILDTFEASISNLEAQLNEREKQYEYYRNKLLTF